MITGGGGGQEGPKCDYVIFECSLTEISPLIPTTLQTSFRDLGSVKVRIKCSGDKWYY